MEQTEPYVGAQEITTSTQVRIGTQRIPLWLTVVVTSAVVSLFVVGFSSGSNLSESPMLRQLNVRLQQAEAANQTLKSQVEGLKGELERQSISFQTTARDEAFQAVNADYFTRLLSLEKDVYQPLGPFWQVTGLDLGEHPQGCVLRGQILGKLSVRRDNMKVKIELFADGYKSRGIGEGTLSSLVPGRYTRFSIVVPTSGSLADVRWVRLTVDQTTGTTAALY